ncbi:hypothetical protein [Microbacterium sp. 18062]|uniref:hypothetical protein n=1 Tax=Microbacterium sp. 18062 TaxID=2681410 RepID=UPI00135B7655|nr:hypothetical protein [Microbacterium sp. 18062]
MTGTRRGALIAAGAALALAAGAVTAIWRVENPPMDAIDRTPPTVAELEAAARTRVLFGHQSVGGNVLDGVDALYEAEGVAAPPVTEVHADGRGALDDDAFLAHAHVGVNGDPFTKLDDLARLVDGPLGDGVDLALVKFCYLDVTAPTDVQALFDEYVHVVEGLERRKPGIRFLHATVPLTTDRSWRASLKAVLGDDDQAGPADNIARYRYNELVRERYADSGRLFDIAAVEATLAQHPTIRSEDGVEYFVLNRALAADAGHLNELGSAEAAAELVRVVAANAP